MTFGNSNARTSVNPRRGCPWPPRLPEDLEKGRRKPRDCGVQGVTTACRGRIQRTTGLVAENRRVNASFGTGQSVG